MIIDLCFVCNTDQLQSELDFKLYLKLKHDKLIEVLTRSSLRYFMKYKLILILLIALSINSNAQSSNEYYPMTVGNRWIYQIKYRYFFNDSTHKGYFISEVIGDTAIEEITYFQLKHTGYSYKNETAIDLKNIDTTGVLYSNFWPVDSLNMELLDTFNLVGYSVCTDISEKNILGINTTSKTIINGTDDGSFIRIYSKGIGLSYLSSNEAQGLNYERTLVYAKVNGKEYGSVPTNIGDRRMYPQKLRLLGNYPNPFNPSTLLMFESPSYTSTVIYLYDSLGRLINKYDNITSNSGLNKLELNLSDKSSGSYFIRIVSGNQVLFHKINLLK